MTARSLLLVACAVAGLHGCEQRYSSNPPPLAPGAPAATTSSEAIDALLAPAKDAGSVAVDASRAMTISLCAGSAQPCPVSDSASADAMYRVVFGSGRAETRTRGQAMADLYKELRDRTAAGERLDAEPHARGDAGAPYIGSGGASSGSSEGDPISRGAFRLLDLVDGVGEVTLGVVHSFGTGKNGCLVSLGRATGTGGQCLVNGPDRPQARPGGGMSF